MAHPNLSTPLQPQQPYPKLYALVPVVNAAVARLTPFLAGFVPLFVGFCLLGMACFGRGTVTFGTFSQVGLFASVVCVCAYTWHALCGVVSAPWMIGNLDPCIAHTQSAMTLFGMMNGDSLHNLIGAARWRGGEGLWGALTLAYFFSYIALAIYVVRPRVCISKPRGGGLGPLLTPSQYTTRNTGAQHHHRDHGRGLLPLPYVQEVYI